MENIEKNIIIKVDNIEINIKNIKNKKYISLTDIAKRINIKNPRFIINNWLRNRNTIEFLGIRENLYNLYFNRIEFDTIKMQSGLN